MLAATNGSMSSTGWFQRTAHDNPMIDTEMALDSMIHNCPNRARANRLRISAEPIRYHDLQRCAPTIRSRIPAVALIFGFFPYPSAPAPEDGMAGAEPELGRLTL